MPSSLSSLVDNLSDGLHCDKYIDCKSYLDYIIDDSWEKFDEISLPDKKVSTAV